MKSIIVSVATIFTLLASDGLQGTASADAASIGIVPAVNVPAPVFTGENAGRGGQASRIELDGDEFYDGQSAYYRLAYVDGGTRLQVYEHSSVGTLGADSEILQSANVGWQVANEIVEPQNRSTASSHLPLWAHVRTSNTDGPSAGLILTLAYLDLLTPGPLVGNLRVAGTGGIAADGIVFAVTGVDVKIATAKLANPDVVFTPVRPHAIDNVTIIDSGSTRDRTLSHTIAEWLNLRGYEQAGRDAAHNPGTVAVVVVHDVRQALAWLCGRTGNPTTCAVAQRAAHTAIATQ